MYNNLPEVQAENCIYTTGCCFWKNECFLKFLKGIVYTYEALFNKETFKKGEFKLEEDTTITIKKED